MENDQLFHSQIGLDAGNECKIQLNTKLETRNADERKMHTHKMNSEDSPKKILLSKRNLNQCHKKKKFLKIYKTMISQENINFIYCIYILN